MKVFRLNIICNFCLWALLVPVLNGCFILGGGVSQKEGKQKGQLVGAPDRDGFEMAAQYGMVKIPTGKFYMGQADENIQLDQSICIAMDNFGRNLGKGFQIQDDILEIFSDTKNMGKSLGSDIISGKQTILTILARDKYPKRWYEILNLFITEKKGLNKIRNFLKESGVKDIAENMASVFFKEAMLCLEKIENVNKLELQNFIDFIKIRGR